MHKKDNLRIYMKEPMKLGFLMAKTLDCRKRICIKGLSKDYLPYSHKSRTFSFRRQSKTLILSTNVDKKSIETEFSVVICRPISNRKHLFLRFFPCSSIVKSVSDCHLPVSLSIDTAPALCISISNYERTTPAKRTITATACIQNEKSGFWVLL